MAKIIQLKDETGADAYPITGANMIDGLANVAKTGSYNDLSNKPTIPTVPAMSTNVEADGTSDSKTSTPKSVKTFVEGKGYYTKPQSGIPASDIAAGVIPTVPTDIVKYTSQSLTDAQKEQARTNIGAADESEVSQLRSEVDGNVGDSACGMNLYSDGKAQARYTANISPLIPVQENDTVTVRTGWTSEPAFVGYMCGYNSSGVFVSGQYWNITASSYLPERTVSITNANVAFIRITYFNNASEAFVKVNGVTKWTYNPPVIGIKDYLTKTGAEKVIYGVNALDYWIEGSYVYYDSGIRSSSTANSTTGYINISGFDKVRFPFSTTAIISSAGACFYTDDYQFISGIAPRMTGTKGWEIVELDVPANAKYLCVSFYDVFLSDWFLTGIINAEFASIDNPILKTLEIKPAIIGSPILYLSESTSDVAASLNSKTAADIYAEYDTMVTNHPTMIKREDDLGVVTYSGVDYPIRAYTIGNNTPFLIDHEPSANEILDSDDNIWTSSLKPKTILVVGGMHGEEHTPCWGLMLAFKEMLDSDATWAHYLKDNFIFKVVPCLNPSGWSTMRREDSQGNVMNRDASISDPETTYYMSWIEENKDAFCLIDCHGTQGRYAYLPTRDIYKSSIVVNKLANYLSAAFRSNWSNFYNSIDGSYGSVYAPYIVAKSMPDTPTIGNCGYRMFVNYGMKSFALETPDDLVTGVITNNDLRNCKLTKDIVINVLQSICALDVLP